MCSDTTNHDEKHDADRNEDTNLISDPSEMSFKLKYYQKYLDNGIDINAKDKSGNTLLGKTIFYGNYRILEILLQRGANPNIRYGQAHAIALVRAIYRKSPKIIELLLDYGANINVNINGKTLIDILFEPTAIVYNKTYDSIYEILQLFNGRFDFTKVDHMCAIENYIVTHIKIYNSTYDTRVIDFMFEMCPSLQHEIPSLIVFAIETIIDRCASYNIAYGKISSDKLTSLSHRKKIK